jgi:hypothetical protein
MLPGVIPRELIDENDTDLGVETLFLLSISLLADSKKV